MWCDNETWTNNIRKNPGRHHGEVYTNYGVPFSVDDDRGGSHTELFWKGNEKVGEEPGVSVYEAHKNINGTYSPVLPFPTNEMAFNDFIYNVKYFTGNKYLVTGDLLDGTDGEPLIKNVKILKKL